MSSARIPLSARLVNIPLSLRIAAGKAWVGIGDDKTPRRPNGRIAHWSDGDELSDWIVAASAVYGPGSRWEALGLVLTAIPNLIWIDLDNVRNPVTGEITDEARGIVSQLPTYWEVSQSGTGLHGSLWGERVPQHVFKLKDQSCASGWPKEEHGNGWRDTTDTLVRNADTEKIAKMEIYCTGHVAAFTGRRLDGDGTTPEVNQHPPVEPMDHEEDPQGDELREYLLAIMDSYAGRRVDLGDPWGRDGRDLSTETGPIEQGGRDNTLWRIGMQLAEQGLAEEQVIAKLMQVNELRCVPPLSEKEVEAKARHCFQRHAERGGILGTNRGGILRTPVNITGETGVCATGTISSGNGLGGGCCHPHGGDGHAGKCTEYPSPEDKPAAEILPTPEKIRKARSKRKLVPRAQLLGKGNKDLQRMFRLHWVSRYGRGKYGRCGVTSYGTVAQGGKKYLVGNRRPCGDWHCLRCGPLRKALWLEHLANELAGRSAWYQKLRPEEYDRFAAAAKQKLKRLHGKHRAFWTSAAEDWVEVISTHEFTKKSNLKGRVVPAEQVREVLIGMLNGIRLRYKEKERLVAGTQEWGCPGISSEQGQSYEHLGDGVSPEEAADTLKRLPVAEYTLENPDHEEPDTQPLGPGHKPAHPRLHWWGIRIEYKSAADLNMLKNLLHIRPSRRKIIAAGATRPGVAG